MYSVIGFSAIPEDGETMVSHYDDEPQQSYQRRAEIALQSWKVEIVSQTGPDLALSSTASSIDLKDFLSKRGIVYIIPTVNYHNQDFIVNKFVL